MRLITVTLILAAVGLAACEPKPKTPGEKLGAAISHAGDKIQDAARDAKH